MRYLFLSLFNILLDIETHVVPYDINTNDVIGKLYYSTEYVKQLKALDI